MATRSTAAGAMLTLMMAWAAPLRAQQPEQPQAWRQAVPAPEAGLCEGGPVAVVAHFLGLAPEQVQTLAQLLRARQETLTPIRHEIAMREQRIRELIASGGDPAEIGGLLIQIHQLRQHAETAQAQFLAQFASLLTEEQRQRWEQVRLAARLQPVLPAFQALQML